jgi:hypothetical protein
MLGIVVAIDDDIKYKYIPITTLDELWCLGRPKTLGAVMNRKMGVRNESRNRGRFSTSVSNGSRKRNG